MNLTNTIKTKQSLLFTLIVCWVSACSMATHGEKISENLPAKRMLLVLDMQNDFLDSLGQLPIGSGQSEELIAFTNSRIQYYKSEKQSVVFVVNEFPANDFLANLFRNDAAIKGSEGAEIIPEISIGKHYKFSKHAPDAFSNPQFDLHLREQGVTEIEIVGVFADQCVLSTIQGGINRGYRFVVNSKGLGAKTQEDIEEALNDMRAMGVVVKP